MLGAVQLEESSRQIEAFELALEALRQRHSMLESADSVLELVTRVERLTQKRPIAPAQIVGQVKRIDLL